MARCFLVLFLANGARAWAPEAELAALLRGAELVREAPKEAEPGAKKPFNPFLVSH